MKRLILALILIAATLPVTGAELEWSTDFAAVQARAGSEKKFVLLYFTGSDWNADCMKMKSEIFDQPAFAAFAEVNLVMAKVDFPHYATQNSAQIAANEKLLAICAVTNYPSVVLLNSAGGMVARTGYVAGGPLVYIAALERVPGMKHVDVSDLATPSASSPEPGAEAPRKPVEFVPIPPATPLYYPELALKAISGSGNRRLALINNENFMVGDIARVKVQDRRVEVICREIREDSVLITADGKPMELKLARH